MPSSLLLVLYREGPVLPVAWMPLVALLDCLSRYSQTAKLGRVLRASSGNFSTVPHMAQTAQTNTFAQELCPLDIACKHSPKPHAPAMHSIQHLVDNFSLVTGACQQGKQGMEPAQSQGAQHGWRQASATSTHPLAFEESKAATHKPPSVGLQNTNTTS